MSQTVIWRTTLPTRQPNRNSESVDNYLKAIFTLGGSDSETPKRVTSNALATKLGVAPASVTNMLQKLAAAANSFVEYERHRGVLLSPAGKRRALEVLRHHRLIETFLYKVLDYPIEELHEEAERLEHFISERFEERIAAKLGHPTFDPHGHSIPTLEGEMPLQHSIPLTEVLAAGTYIVDSISDRDAPTLRSLKSSGMTPGTKLRVTKSPTDSYSVRIGRSAKPLDLTPEVAREIRILPLTK
jgi:DtxR family transcriptional regulator, Mn-dependent transcriptional regulator